MNKPGPAAKSLRPGLAADRGPHTGPGDRQGASDWARRQTRGPGGRQGASDWARRQTGGLRLGLAADRGPQTREMEGEGGSRSGPSVGRKRGVCHVYIMCV